MNRRNFINSGFSAMAAFPLITNPSIKTILKWNNFFRKEFPSCGIINPQNTRLIIKPVMTNMVHTGVWEGPCRNNVVTVEEEKQSVNDFFNSWSNDLKSQKSRFDPEYVNLLEPSLIVFNEDFTIYPEQFDIIEQDVIQADALFVSPAGASIATYRIAEKYKKPIISDWGLNCRTVDIAAYTRSHGLEMYVPIDLEEMNRVILGLRAKKILSGTNILYPTDWGWPSVASITGINEPEKLKDRFGINLITIPYEKLSSVMEEMIQNTDIQKKSEELAQILLDNADLSYIDKKYVIKSFVFYESIIRLMNEYHCNAFTIECFEFCTSQLPEKWEITPCLVHTLFKDQGIPSACEGDFASLIGMELLMSLSGKSPHLGNMFMEKNDSMQINHSVPGTKMNGFNEPPLPYQLGRFVESGWGTKIVVDFMNNEEKKATVIRMDPTARRLLALKGKLVDSAGWGEDILSCSVSAYVVGWDSGTAKEFIKKQVDYGNHLVWVFGDYSEELKTLAEILKMDIEIIT
jgi:hypothetical protein